MTINSETQVPSPTLVPQRRLRGIVRAVAILLGLGLVVWGSSYIVREYWIANARAVYKSNLKKVVAAVLQYEQDHGRFPPAYTVSPEGKPLHSWRVLILPYLGEQELYNDLRLDQPSNSPHNRRFRGQRPAVYTNKWVADPVPGATHLLAIVGRQTMWPEQHAVRSTDIQDGIDNTGFIVAYPEKFVDWMETNDLSELEWNENVFAPKPPGTVHHHGVELGFVSGQTRFVSRTTDPELLRSLISINGGAPLPGVKWPPPRLSQPYEIRQPLSSSKLPLTAVTPVLDFPIADRKNAVYCATFQIAWDEMQSQLKVPAGRSPLIDALNAAHFDTRDLSTHSRVVWSGPSQNFEEARQQLRRNFGPYTDEWFLSNSQPEGDFVIYAALAKYLPFHVKFDRWSVPLRFAAANNPATVHSFGVEKDLKDDERSHQLIRQVDVLDHVGDDNFIIRLNTREDSDGMYLAKIPRAATLGATLQAAQQRIKVPATNGFRRTVGGGDKLQIPVLALGIDHDYRDLCKAAGLAGARQTILFRLDEAGGRLESEAIIIGEFGDEYDAQRPRMLVFDQPFLFWMQERTAGAPYFVAWIANAELMENFQQAK